MSVFGMSRDSKFIKIYSEHPVFKKYLLRKTYASHKSTPKIIFQNKMTPKVNFYDSENNFPVPIIPNLFLCLS